MGLILKAQLCQLKLKYRTTMRKGFVRASPSKLRIVSFYDAKYMSKMDWPRYDRGLKMGQRVLQL